MKIRILFLVILLAFSNSVYASLEDLVIPCAGCNSDEAAWMASRGAPMNQSAHIYIADFESETLMRFHIKSEVVDGSSYSQSSPADVDSQVKALFDEWLRVKEVIEHVTIDAPESVGVMSAYDLVGRSRDQGLIGSYIFDNKSVILNFPEEVISDSASFVALAASPYYSKTKVVEITVVFPDESQALYKMSFPRRLEDSTVDIDHVVESCMDSDGNYIPEGLRAYEDNRGELFITDPHGTNFTQWKERAARFGFELEGNYEDFASSVCSYNCFRTRCKLKCQAAN